MRLDRSHCMDWDIYIECGGEEHHNIVELFIAGISYSKGYSEIAKMHIHFEPGGAGEKWVVVG